MPFTPGVYIEDKNAFPGSVVSVETALPVFIGYTEKAERREKSLLHVPTKISSLQEYIELFGTGFNARFKIVPAVAGTNEETFLVTGKKMQAAINKNNCLYFYNAIRFFYGNGGSKCYILSVGTYAGKPGGIKINFTDFTGDANRPNIFTLLEKETEPSLVVLPDIIANGIAAYSLYKLVLQHCNKMQSRFAIFDVAQTGIQNTDDDIAQFRNEIGTSFLNYGAAYYPWLKTVVVQQGEINFTNLDATADLENLLPEAAAKKIVTEMKLLNKKKLQEQTAVIHQALMACSNTYAGIMQAIKNKLNILPASAAMAGIYSLVDNTRGVWKAPANVSLAMVISPCINITSTQQQTMNVDVLAGKSINVIRPFVGKGTLVWGARTLDGNSQDWRYINVKRTMIMIEQSLKLACRTYVFEPNDSNTWITIKSMINNFLFNLWKQGALAGTVPQQAYSVQIGLGQTMTANDILDGLLRVSVLLAIVRPAESIIITFQQQQQQS